MSRGRWAVSTADRLTVARETSLGAKNNWPGQQDEQKGLLLGIAATIAGVAKKRVPVAHPQLRVKQQLLRSKDGNGNSSCRDSDVELPGTLGFTGLT
jgi:hypothetical protein